MQVFISFSSADRKIAEKIHDRLNRKGIDCWICTKDIPPGADYQACIVEAINACKVVVLVFSSNANLSPEIAKELSLASKKILIPARIEDVVPQGSFQYQLSNRQFVDLFDDFDDKLDELTDRIKAVVATPGETVPATAKRKTSARSSNGGLKMAVGAAFLVALAAGGWLVKGKLAGPAGADAAVGAAALAPSAAVLGAPSASAATVALPAPASAPAAATSSASMQAPVAVTGATTPAAAPPAADGPSQLSAVLPLLTGSNGADRANLLVKMNDRIPMNLDSADASALLADAGAYRASALRAIAPHLAPQMGGAAVARVLGELNGAERVNSIVLLTGEGKIRAPLTAQEAKQVLDGTSAYRTSGVRALVSQLPPAMGGSENDLVLQDINGSDRVNSIALLAGNGKIKSPLTAPEAKQLLDGTNAYRPSGLRALLAQLPPAMAGKDAAFVMQDINGSDRVNALASMAGAGKLHAALTADDARVLLDGTHSYRPSGVNAIVNNLAGALDAKALVVILGDTNGSDRLNALSALARANRIGKLQSAELDPVLAPTGPYRGQAAQIVAQNVGR